MTALDQTAPSAQGAVRLAPSSLAQSRQVDAFDIHIDTDWATAAPKWRTQLDAAAPLPFQAFTWLDAWYRTIAPAMNLAPRLVTVNDKANGHLAMLLPLVAKPGRTGPVLQFADANLTDFNAPILGPAIPPAGEDATLWHALAAKLGASHVAVDFRKMPALIGTRRNPLTTHPDARPCPVASHAIALDGTFQTFRQSLERRTRMDLERCWRIARQQADMAFTPITDPAEALTVIETLDRQQRARLAARGSPFHLDRPAERAFYRHDLAARLATGQLHSTALKAGQEIIAALYAISDGHTVVVLRISNAAEAWSRLSPGRLIVDKSIEHFYQCGLQVCDLSIGDYDYKRRLGTTRTPLVDLVAALTWRGVPLATRHRMVSALRSYPSLNEHVRRWTGKVDGRLSGTRNAAIRKPTT